MAAKLRRPQFSGFYPGDLRRQIDGFLAEGGPPPPTPPRVAAVVPHAGWRYSGGVAARTLKALAEGSGARSVVILGAVHRVALEASAVFPEGRWETPLGALDVDALLAREVLDELGDLVVEAAGAHDSEHSIEVQLPFIRELFPGAPILPILVPPDARPVELGTRLARILGGGRAVLVATTDLTHYGDAYGFLPAGVGESAHSWMRANDRRIIDLAVRLRAEQILVEAERNGNACGPGALAAVVAFARALGAEGGMLLERTDSHEVAGGGEPFRMAVGYAGIVF